MDGWIARAGPRPPDGGPADPVGGRSSSSGELGFNYLGPLLGPNGGPVRVRSMPEACETIRLRGARRSDARAIAAIYNEEVATTVATMDTEPRTLDAQRTLLREHVAPWVAIVATSEGKVVGWASLSPWSERRAYAPTAEVSVYVAADHRGRGVGGRLLARLIELGRAAGLHSLLARIADRNVVSLRLHYRHGFESVGVLREVGRKFGKWVDVRVLQRRYRSARAAAAEEARGRDPRRADHRRRATEGAPAGRRYAAERVPRSPRRPRTGSSPHRRARTPRTARAGGRGSEPRERPRLPPGEPRSGRRELPLGP